jgi:hypothetical protein
VLIQHTLTAVHDLLAQAPPAPTTPPATPADGDTIINTAKIMGWVAKAVLPILFAVAGVTIIGTAGKGRFSQVLNHATLLLIGVVVLAGAPLFFLFGDKFANLIFG